MVSGMRSRPRAAFFGLALLLPFASAAASEREAADAEIRRLFAEQVEAWNRGDAEAFTSVYAEDALFVSSSGVTRGRAEVLARYRRRYPDGRAMGRLTLAIDELRISAGAEVVGARVLATWTLEREGSPPRSGPTLVVLERRDGRFWITEDASMELEPAR
jgi:uncharacterized protein (TIGR02246 family)